MGELVKDVERAIEKERENVKESKAEMDYLQTASSEALQTVEYAYQKSQEIETIVSRNSAMELAQEQINLLTQRKLQEFDAHQYVRRVMLGVVRDLDLGLVRLGTIQDLSDQLWIQCSDFWLSHALMAISAWIRNERNVCENAVRACIRTDPGKGALFFCLMNLRMERNEAARQWLQYYFENLDPSAMEPESGILLQAYLGGLFGQDPVLQANVDAIVSGWRQELTHNGRTDETIRREYFNYILYLPREPRSSFEVLSRVSIDSDLVEHQREQFGKLERMAYLIASLKAEEAAEDADEQRKRSDRILDRLLHEKVPAEQEIDELISNYRRILKHRGDKSLAQAEYIMEQTGSGSGDEEENEYTSIKRADRRAYQVGIRMVRWALDEKGEVSSVVRRYAMRNTSFWLIEAAHEFYERNEKGIQLLPRLRLQINGWQGMTDGEDIEELKESIQEYFGKRKMQIMIFNSTNIIALMLALFTLALTFVTPYSLAGTAAMLLFLVFRIVSGLQRFGPMVEASIQDLDDAVRETADFYAEARQEKQHLAFLEEEVNDL